jgi:hypothetical protein
MKSTTRSDQLWRALTPLRLYLCEWDESRLYGISPREARHLLRMVERIEAGLFDLHRALEQKSITSRDLG